MQKIEQDNPPMRVSPSPPLNDSRRDWQDWTLPKGTLVCSILQPAFRIANAFFTRCDVLTGMMYSVVIYGTLRYPSMFLDLGRMGKVL